MRETEAAATLQVTPRTLYRYRQSGKIAYREIPGKTRPLIDYDPADVEALKVILESQRERSRKAEEKPGRASSRAQRVAFGLPPEGYAELAEEAARYGMSAGEYARHLVREGLEKRLLSETAEFRAEVGRLRQEIERVRHDFAGGFEAILEFTGLSADEAKQWVMENLR